MKAARQLLAHRRGRLLLFTLLYLSEGGPIGFIWWALPTLLRSQDVAVAQITGLTATLVLPWTLKFLWAPLIDTLRAPAWGYRNWIISAQLLMGLALIPLIWLDPVVHFNWWWLLLLVHAFAAATQDVSIDALAIRMTPDSERGILNGGMQAGLLLGRSVFGGGALLVLATLGRTWIMLALILCIWFTLALVFLVEEPIYVTGVRNSLADFRKHLAAAVRLRRTWFALAFALVSAAGFEATGQLAGPFLLDRGASEATVGLFFGVAVIVAMLTGGLIGGRLSDRVGRIRSTAIFLTAFALAIITLAVADLFIATGPAILIALLSVVYFCIGLFVASSYALYMHLTDRRLGGTQFSTYMAATNACESWSAWAGGRLVAAASYPASFIVMSVVSLAALPLLSLLREKER